MTEMEQRLRELLEQEGASLGPVAPWRPEAVGGKAVGLRRRRRLRVVAAAAAVPAVAAGAVWFAGLGASARPMASAPTTVGAAPATAPSSHASPLPTASSSTPAAQASSSVQTSSAPAAPAAKVVLPGVHVRMGHGQSMVLTPTHRDLYDERSGISGSSSVVNGNQPAGTVSLQSGGGVGTKDSYYSPLYIGPGQVARMTVQVGAKVYEVQVVTLAGHPGYATGYVWGSSGSGADRTTNPAYHPTVTVYDATGKVLARF